MRAVRALNGGALRSQEDVLSYVKKHGMHQRLQDAFQQVCTEQPENPLDAIAQLLSESTLEKTMRDAGGQPLIDSLADALVERLSASTQPRRTSNDDSRTKSSVSFDEYQEEESLADEGDQYPRVVVSYQSAQTEMLDEVNSYFESWGFHVWDGRGVKAGKNWIAQWCDKVTNDSTVLIVFLLSKEFLESQACYDEFFFVMGDKKLNSRALPVMCNLETMEEITGNVKRVDFKMKLGTKNYVHPQEGWQSKLKEGSQFNLETCGIRWPEVGEVSGRAQPHALLETCTRVLLSEHRGALLLASTTALVCANALELAHPM